MWILSKIWNTSIELKPERPVTPRAKIWASELGKSDLDIFLKMMGEAPSNPPDARANRKFEAGNLFEWIVQLVLMRSGIYKESQRWIGNSEFGLDVSGKLDHVAGGKPKYDLARQEIDSLGLPELFGRATGQILDYFASEYPNGLPEQIIEVKSTSSFGIEKVYFTGKALAGHDLQAFHYSYNTKIPAMVLYICRDDLRMAEIPVLSDDQELLSRYKAKIESVARYYNQKVEPPKEPMIVYDPNEKKFSKNFNVEYSQYLKRNYKIETPDEYDEVYGKIVESFNRVLGRVKEGKEMTDNNLEKIGRMTEMGFNFEEIKKSL